MGNLHFSRPHHRKLPAELNREIFLCFNPATQRKFICGLGWDFYAMFRHRLLTKTKIVRNPHGNRWNWYSINTRHIIAADRLNLSNIGHSNVFAEQPFPISGPQCRVDEFPGTICYYYEVEVNGNSYHICNLGVSDGANRDHHNSWVGHSNSYAISTDRYDYRYGCSLAGESHCFELPEGADRPRWKRNCGNIFGCGLVINPEDKLWIFFTLNGKLMGRKFSISPTVDRLFPAINMALIVSIKANFGDDPAKPLNTTLKIVPGCNWHAFRKENGWWRKCHFEESIFTTVLHIPFVAYIKYLGGQIND